MDQAGVLIDSAGVAISYADSTQSEPAVVAGVDHYLTVWQDERLCATAHYDIYGCRVDESGNILDPEGILLGSWVPGLQCNPAAAFDGTNYMVVWEDYRNGSYPEFYSDIYGIRISQTGEILDDIAFPITKTFHSQTLPAIAFDGTNYLVVWVDLYGDYLRGSRVAPSGSVLDTFSISSSSYVIFPPYVTFGDSNYFVTWPQPFGLSFGIYGWRISTTGVVLDTTGILITANVLRAEHGVTSGTTDYFVVWRDWPGNNIYGARVTQAGVVIDTSGIAISIAQNVQENPKAAFNGATYCVVWEDYRHNSGSWADSADIYGARVSQAGVVLDTEGIVISDATGSQSAPWITFDGTDHIVVWEDNRHDYYFDLYGAKINSAGFVFDACSVVAEPRNQNTPYMTKGNISQILITYAGWTDVINQLPGKTTRIWSMFNPLSGIGESDKDRYRRIDIAALPNPFHHTLKMICSIEDYPQNIMVAIYDVSGRLVRTIEHHAASPEVIIQWDGKNSNGQELPAGVYFCGAYVGTSRAIKKIVLVR